MSRNKDYMLLLDEAVRKQSERALLLITQLIKNEEGQGFIEYTGLDSVRIDGTFDMQQVAKELENHLMRKDDAES